MNHIAVREMHDGDCPEVSRVVCASFRHGAERDGFTEEQIQSYFSGRGSETAIREQFRQYQCLVACAGQTIAGVVALKGNEITKLYVDPRLLRRGIGSMLFEQAERIVSQGAHEDLVVHTVFKSGIPFYEAMGMATVDSKPVAFGPLKGTDSTLLRKSLVSR